MLFQEGFIACFCHFSEGLGERAEERLSFCEFLALEDQKRGRLLKEISIFSMQSGLFASFLPKDNSPELPRSLILPISLDRLLRLINIHSTDLPGGNLQKPPPIFFLFPLIPIPHKIEDDSLLLVIKLLRSSKHLSSHNHLLRVHLFC